MDIAIGFKLSAWKSIRNKKFKYNFTGKTHVKQVVSIEEKIQSVSQLFSLILKEFTVLIKFNTFSKKWAFPQLRSISRLILNCRGLVYNKEQ